MKRKMRCITAPECKIMYHRTPSGTVRVDTVYEIDDGPINYCAGCMGTKCAEDWCDTLRGRPIVRVRKVGSDWHLVDLPLSFFTEILVNNVTVLRKALNPLT